jgi:colanic acid/amylovoran biosynthesis protein
MNPKIAANPVPHTTDSATPAGRAVTRACVLGASLDVGNRGVLALAVSVARLIARTVPGVAIAFHYGHATAESKRLHGDDSAGDIIIEVLNCRLSPKSAPGQHILVILVLAALYRVGIRGPARRNAWLRSLLDADFIGDITGGDSFSDIYGFARFLTGSLPLLSVVLLGRPFVMLPQTYGPFKAPWSRGLGRLLLRRAAVLLTRDKNCAPLVASLSGRTPVFCPDVAFTLDAVKPARLAVGGGRFSVDDKHPLIGVNVSGLLYMGGYTGRNMFGLRSDYRELVDQLIESLLTSTNATILLVPHVFGAEREEEACASLLASAGARHPGRVFSLQDRLSERELKWVIGRTEFFVGSRMHACIAALSQCVPAAGLAYSDKFLGVFESAGVGDTIIDLRHTETSAVISRTRAYFERRAELRNVLANQIPRVQDEVRATFHRQLRRSDAP